MLKAWIESSTPSSSVLTWNGKTAPLSYLHKQLDITETQRALGPHPGCATFLPHGDTTTKAPQSRAGTAVLSQVRAGSHRSAHLRRLLRGDLPALRHAAGKPRRTGNRLDGTCPGIRSRAA